MKSSSDTPATPGVELGLREKGEPGGGWPYREALGSLVWLSTTTRPDVSNAVRAVACTITTLRTGTDWKAVTKITAYLHGTRGLRIDIRAGFEIGFDSV